MIPAIDAADEDNNDDDDDGHDESEGVDGRNAGRENDWFYRPFECLRNTFRLTRMKTTTTKAVRPPLVTKTILVLEFHPHQVRQQFILQPDVRPH